MPSKKQIIDATILWASKLRKTDDTRLDETLLGYTVEQVRATEILKEYNTTGIIDQNWLVDFGLIELTKVSIADDPIIDFCECDIMKAQIPSIISLTALGEGNLDLGLKVMSACAKKQYTYYPLDFWKQIPREHTRNKFNYYQRFGNIIYVNKIAHNLRFYGIPETTEGLFIKKTLPVISGSVKAGVTYMVKGTTGMIAYNNVNYLPTQTFVGLSGIPVFVASGTSQLFYNDYKVEMTDKDPYPVSAHMARNIVISILSTELQIEKQQVADVVNDSADDALK